MFTGIIEELGKVQVIKGVNKGIGNGTVTIECVAVLEGTKLGDSIAVNGVCLTVTNITPRSFSADISPETFNVTALDELKSGSIVNLERAMKADGRFGGHIVSGHIDGFGKVLSIKPSGNFYLLKISLNKEQEKYVINKGSIAINGISLTIAQVDKNLIDIAIIPHTFEKTNLKNIKAGDNVNIEVDLMAKYIEKFLSPSNNKSIISLEFLQEHGF